MISEAELRRDFDEFCCRMRRKWHSRDDLSNEFSEVPVFREKSKWKPPLGHPSLEVYLSKIEKELFAALTGFTRKRNLTKGDAEPS